MIWRHKSPYINLASPNPSRLSSQLSILLLSKTEYSKRFSYNYYAYNLNREGNTSIHHSSSGEKSSSKSFVSYASDPAVMDLAMGDLLLA